VVYNNDITMNKKLRVAIRVKDVILPLDGNNYVVRENNL
jgi:hypothetical protein